MISRFSKLLRKESSTGPAQQARLRLARFRHLLRQYGRMIALASDAAEKQSGEFILDKAYILALGDKAFETTEGIIYDLNVLTSQRHLEFYDAVDLLRAKTTMLIKTWLSASSSAPNGSEEPEYRLLENMREMLFQANSPVIPSNKRSSDRTLFDIAESAQEVAADTLADLTRSLNPAYSASNVHAARLLPIRATVIDLMHSLAGSKEPSEIPDPLSADSAPTKEFLAAFFARQFWSDRFCDPAALESACLVVFGLEDSMNATIFHQGGYYLFDAYLSCTADSNYIYCRFPSGNELSAAAGILARLGFSVSKMRPGVTGWFALQPLDVTTVKLEAIGKMAAFLLQLSITGMQPDGIEDAVNRFFQMPV